MHTCKTDGEKRHTKGGAALIYLQIAINIDLVYLPVINQNKQQQTTKTKYVEIPFYFIAYVACCLNGMCRVFEYRSFLFPLNKLFSFHLSRSPFLWVRASVNVCSIFMSF